MSDYEVNPEFNEHENLFEKIAGDLQGVGYSINSNALPTDVANALLAHLQDVGNGTFERAGVGRDTEYLQDELIRRDEISWISEDFPAGQLWLNWCDELQHYMNKRLFLGLFSFESHFAHYSAGDFYQRHCDAFRGQANRVLTMVVYLNPNWREEYGGELVVYQNDADQDGLKVLPSLGTVAIFLSEEFPHEVLPADRDRYSIAGWYRVNASTSGRIDPPK